MLHSSGNEDETSFSTFSHPFFNPPACPRSASMHLTSRRLYRGSRGAAVRALHLHILEQTEAFLLAVSVYYCVHDSCIVYCMRPKVMTVSTKIVSTRPFLLSSFQLKLEGEPWVTVEESWANVSAFKLSLLLLLSLSILLLLLLLLLHDFVRRRSTMCLKSIGSL